MPRNIWILICPTIAIVAAVWLGTLIGYDRAIKANHEATAIEKELIIAEYWCDLSHGESVRVCDPFRMYRPYKAPEAKHD